MKFDDAVQPIRTITDLRRVSSAHVVDHNQLIDDQLRAGLIKVKPQYLHEETVRAQLDDILQRDGDEITRTVAHLLLVDVLLNQFDCTLPFGETEEKVIAFEQSLIDSSNETEVLDLACGDKSSQRMRDLELYNFVLETAWEGDSVSPDEANLLTKLRRRLRINLWEHRILESKLKKFPKPGNELHTRSEINQVRRELQCRGLVFPVRTDDGDDLDVIPEELEAVIRQILELELRLDAYRELLLSRPLRKKAHYAEVLDKSGVVHCKSDTLDTLLSRVLHNVPVSRGISSNSPRYGLSSEELADWCKDLGLTQAGATTRWNQFWRRSRCAFTRSGACVEQRPVRFAKNNEYAHEDFKP
jgi:hypothetical protein